MIKGSVQEEDITIINIYAPNTGRPKYIRPVLTNINGEIDSADGKLTQIDHILGHKASLNKFKQIKIISSIFSDHNDIKLEITYKKKTVTPTNMWRLNNMLLSNQ